MVIEGSRIYEWAVQKLENKGKRKQREKKRLTIEEYLRLSKRHMCP